MYPISLSVPSSGDAAVLAGEIKAWKEYRKAHARMTKYFSTSSKTRVCELILRVSRQQRPEGSRDRLMIYTLRDINTENNSILEGALDRLRRHKERLDIYHYRDVDSLGNVI